MPGLDLTSFTTPTAMVIVVLLGIALIFFSRRINRRHKPSAADAAPETDEQRAVRERGDRERHVARSRRTADIGTYIIASIATFAALLGMWPIATNSVALAGVPSSWITAASLIAVGMVEGTIIISGIRSRANIIAGEPSGADGIAMWVAVAASAVLSSLEVAFGDHKNVSAGEIAVAVLARMAAPVIAGFLWERGLAPERRAAGDKQTVHSLLTLRRLLVRLGLAAPHDADLSSLDRGFRLSKVARHINNAKRRRWILRWWSRTQARTSLITAVRYNAIQTPEGMSLGDHIGLHALAEKLIATDARAPMHLVDARQGATSSTADPDQPRRHEATVGHESLASGHPAPDAPRRQPAAAGPNHGQPRHPDPAKPTARHPDPAASGHTPTHALNSKNVQFGFAAGIRPGPIGTAMPASAWTPGSQLTVSPLPAITMPDQPRRHTSGSAPDATTSGHPDPDASRLPEVGPDPDPDAAPESGPTPPRRRRSPEELIEAVRQLDPSKATLSPNYVATKISCSWRRAKELLEETGRLPVPEPQEGE